MVSGMSLSGKRIWIDVEQPKTAIMYYSLYKMFKNEDAELLITARDYDSTYKILDDSDIRYKKIGSHGGEKLENKLEFIPLNFSKTIRQIFRKF